MPSTVAGEFHDGEAYDHWHMGRIFSGDPTLNSTFVAANPTNRVYQSTTNHQLLVMAKHSIQARRPIAKVGTPRMSF